MFSLHRLLRCGFHRCRKTCHVAGECENCDQICLKRASFSSFLRLTNRFFPADRARSALTPARSSATPPQPAPSTRPARSSSTVRSPFSSSERVQTNAGSAVTCACGHLKQRARCATSASRPEGNRDRFIKCTDMVRFFFYVLAKTGADESCSAWLRSGMLLWRRRWGSRRRRPRSRRSSTRLRR